MDVEQIKNTIRGLVEQSESVSKENDSEIQSLQFTRPFFESLGWDFNTDVKSENFEGSEIKAFQIDSVTRFYLKEFPLTSPLESLTEDIKSAVSFAYNKGVTWAVITNFKETRVYNTESTGRTLGAMQHYSFLSSEYIEKFQKLSDLTKKQFSLNVLDDSAEYFGKKPKRVSIDKQLLEDLLDYRNILVDDIAKENSVSVDDAEFAAQKILNRLIFIRSCGDRQIENRLLKEELHKWEEKKDKKLIYHLQDIFSYFRGRYGSTLFEKHRCDDLIISDKVLHQVIEGTYQSKKKAVRYNFAHIEHDSLGKMYENYLGTVQQKKDGAYYTPSYISKYICENTIIPYLSKSDVTNIPDLISEYSGNLEELEAKLNDIKILDPACGTGEFLIRAIDVLLEISSQIQAQKEADGQYTHTVRGKKSGTVSYQTFGKDVENKEIRRIIQNNIYGVDINKEAIEITKLNMFLKLATSSQQLIDLSKNIIVGNALIDDPSVDPINAFEWEKKFAHKFDVIVGNPPYVRQEKIKSIKPFLQKNYIVYDGVADLYVYFFELGLTLLKDNGVLNYIISNKWMKTDYGKNLRTYLEKYFVNEIIDFGDTQIFDGATTYPCIIRINNNYLSNEKVRCVIINNKKFNMLNSHISKNLFYFNQNDLKQKSWNIQNPKISEIFNRISLKSDSLGKIVANGSNRGILTGADNIFILDEDQKEYFIKKDPNCKKLIKPHLSGKEVQRYRIESKNKYILLIKKGTDINEYPIILEYLLPHKELLENRSDKGEWYSLRSCTYYEEFLKPKIIYGKVATGPRFTFDTEGFIVNTSNYILRNSNLELMGILNSKLGWFFVKNTCTYLNGGYGLLWTYMKNIPITKRKSKKLENLVKKIIILNKQFYDKKEEKIRLEIKIIDEEIEKEVYRLYDITDEEKAIIESSV